MRILMRGACQAHRNAEMRHICYRRVGVPPPQGGGRGNHPKRYMAVARSQNNSPAYPAEQNTYFSWVKGEAVRPHPGAHPGPEAGTGLPSCPRRP